ncbi:12013_t:CDS:2 [Acaulospora morrowiae]|uniref:12013_t:CDS:1 n=1 Tax=Acaulospora morrowiae TaxID=94023 RepID=A0A9N9CEM9_9GLOM|nr:12013_t:CDS:2 [Acaulospora morrowiae]
MDPDDILCETCDLEYTNEYDGIYVNPDNDAISDNNITNEYDKIAKTDVAHPVEYRPPAIQPLVNPEKEYKFTVVSGASRNHFCPLKSWIYLTNKVLKGFDARIVIYDLGLSKKQRKGLLKLVKLGYITDLRTFKFSEYPSFWDISIARGEYGWKPAIVAEVARDYPGILIWLDSGTLAERKYFVNLPKLLKKYDGFISPVSQGQMKKWTHPGVYEYFGDEQWKYDNYLNCNGASLTFDTYITEKLIDAWYRCSLDKNCIAPPGSSRANHRQDQSILTYLAARDGWFCSLRPPKLWLKTHQDKGCRSIVKTFETKKKKTN